MRVVVTGATGLLGKALISQLIINGDSVAVLTRNVQHAKNILPLNVDVFHWNPSKCMPPLKSLEQSDAVVHLAGESVQGRWTKTKKDRILQSRVLGTSNLVSALKSMDLPPTKLVSASAVGYYGDRGDEQLTEYSNRGHGFLSDVVDRWESSLEPLTEAGIQSTSLRLGMILSDRGGALKKLLLPWNLGLGLKIGDGSQWWPRIHVDDAVGIINHALKTDPPTSAINAVAPEEVTQTQFADTLAKVLSRPRVFQIPKFLLRAIIGEMSCELISSRRATSSTSGYQFLFPSLSQALTDLIQRGQRNQNGLKVFQTEMLVDVAIDKVFEFFSDPANLEELTPPWLNFKIISPQPLSVGLGAIIDYKLRVHRIPIRWQSEITEWDPPRFFVDVQKKGPYRHWEHTHEFQPSGGATLVRDTVRYNSPGGSIVDKLFVRRDIERIFSYRQHKLNLLLNDEPTSA